MQVALSEGSTRKKRNSKSKSRNGCKTCKVRRVKCDERLPCCLRCERGNYDCEGYDDNNSSTMTARAIVPRVMADFKPILYQPHKVLIFNDREHHYFQKFCDQMAPRLAGHFDSDLWDRLVLQACETDRSIRSAIIALAALDSTSDLIHAPGSTESSKSLEAKRHHQFAIRHYSKAIHSMRKAALEGNQELRITLITCMVIICFETFHGNHDSAARQAIIGLDLIENRVGARRAIDAPVPSVEDELLRAFERLDVQTMTFIDPRPAKRHKDLTNVGQYLIETMPDKFTSLDEARDILALVMRRSLHFMASLLPETQTSGLLKVDISVCLPDIYIKDRESHMDELRRWYASCLPLLIHAKTVEGRNDFIPATSLELQYLACYFSCAVIPTDSEGRPNTRSFMPVFEQIVAGAEAILEHPNTTHFPGTYLFEVQVVAILYSVAWRCPQRTLRRKAISLLLSKPRREGLWDSAMAGKLAEWIMLTEEEGFEGEYAPEELRITCVDILEFNMAMRNARVSCLVPTGQSKTWIPKETVISW